MAYPNELVEVCLNCGEPAKELRSPTIRPVVVHVDTGMIACNNLSGTMACLPDGCVG